MKNKVAVYRATTKVTFLSKDEAVEIDWGIDFPDESRIRNMISNIDRELKTGEDVFITIKLSHDVIILRKSDISAIHTTVSKEIYEDTDYIKN